MTWRLLWSGYADGYTNMAVDEAMMWAAAELGLPPTLRLYGWRPAAVSLGYFQQAEGQVDRAELERRGWDLVRRPTGGRAILHDDELTYSVTIPQAALTRGESTMGSYREISRGLELGLQRLGVSAALGETAADPTHRETARDLPTVCFAQASRCDLVAAGRKVVGSAQVRKQGIILQHGSVPLRLNLDDQIAVMPGRGDRGESRDRLGEAAQGIAEVLGSPLSFEQLGQALVAGFEEAFETSLTPGDLTAEERARVEELRDTKYTTEEWNLTAPGRR
ncbi:MAG TPA: lipoate--protein ligase family protein [Armatimonadota bacterium]|jgi:lipoate-protein ligase A